MIIKQATASFGKLNNETIRFHDGLNVINRPNESGKSTWCAFIRAMLYGIDSSERGAGGRIPEKQRYAPWSGAPMEGSMDLISDRCEITVTRRTSRSGAPMHDFSAVYTGTAIPVEGLDSKNAGMELTGVSREVFNRSAFMGQGSAAISSSPELEKRIMSILSSGEEDTSYSETDDRLRAWQRKRRYNRKGFLPELEGQMDETSLRIDEIERISAGVAEKEAELAACRRECAELESAVTESRKRCREEYLQKVGEARERYKQAGAAESEALENLNAERDALRAGPLGGKKAEVIDSEAEDDLFELQGLQKETEKKVSPVLPLLFFLLALAAAVVYERVIEHLALLIGAGVLTLVAIILLIVHLKKKNSKSSALARISQILEKYGASSVEEITEVLNEFHRLHSNMLTAEEKEKLAKYELEDAEDALYEIERAAVDELDFTGGSSEAAVLGRQLLEMRDKEHRLSNEIAEEAGSLRTKGDPLVLRSDYERMSAEYAEIQSEYDALEMAIEAMKAADLEIQSRFSPELGKVAGNYMSIMTGGKYKSITLNRDFTAKTQTEDDAVARESAYLSTGTADLMYLAVRLAVCELALPTEGESCPLIIDDALVNLDEERSAQALELLKQIAKTRQVILFTCR